MLHKYYSPENLARIGVFALSFIIFSLARSRFIPLTASGPDQALLLAGDEPAYLLLAHSIVTDHDVNLYNNCVNRDGRSFGAEASGGHAARRDRMNKKIYSIHTPGLAMLIAPAYALGLHGPIAPRPAVCVFLNIIAALLAVNIYLFCGELSSMAGTTARWPALIATAAAVLTPPLLFYANLIYPELPAALLILYAARYLLFPPFPASLSQAKSRGPFAVSCAIAFLPWLSFRFFLPAFVLLVLACLRTGDRRDRARAVVWPPLIFCVSLLIFFAYQYRAFGTINPAAGYIVQNFGKRGFFSRGMLDGLVGIILDRGQGIVTWSPVYVLSLTGLLLLLREYRRSGVWLVLLLASIYLPGANFVHWWGGFSPPARFLVASTPLLAGALCYALSRNPGKIFLVLFAVLLTISLIFGYMGVMHPRYLYRRRHIITNYPAVAQVTRIFPSCMHKGRATWPLAGVWCLTIIWGTLYLARRTAKL
ncbi:MAG: hypothetical protein NT045_09910, partial [Candidatus Aureabacteria bacterium]|nr:hypothetical protein [Candidatus Auribacterota bacterium]